MGGLNPLHFGTITSLVPPTVVRGHPLPVVPRQARIGNDGWEIRVQSAQIRGNRGPAQRRIC